MEPDGWRLVTARLEPQGVEQRAPEAGTSAPRDVRVTTCCVVGAGPAGAVLALLLARQGIPVVLLEAQGDFDRDFRGDTVHPAILEALDAVGVADLWGCRNPSALTRRARTRGGDRRARAEFGSAPLW